MKKKRVLRKPMASENRAALKSMYRGLPQFPWLNLAVTDLVPSMVKMHGLVIPLHAPSQPENTLSPIGYAVIVTVSPYR